MTLVTAIALTTLFVSLVLVSQPMAASADWTFASGFDPHGGYIDTLIWEVYPAGADEAALLALRLGTIDGYDERVGVDQIGPLLATPGVEVRVMLGTIYRQFNLNCVRFPTNITGYRRALAYVTDKYLIVAESTGGLGVPMDGAIPIPVGLYCQEQEMTEHYYAYDNVSAIAELEAAGFKDLTGNRYREYDVNHNGVWDPGLDLADTDPSMTIEAFCSAGWNPAIQAVTAGVNGLDSVGIHAVVSELDFDSMIARMEAGDFNWGCFSWNLDPPGEPDLLYEFFRQGAPDNEFFYRFHNATYNIAADNMMAATSYAEVLQYVQECQDILIDQMPMVTCYNDAYIHAFRSDKWEGYVNFTGAGFMGNNWYTPSHVRLKASYGGPYGGTYRMCLSQGMDTTNIIDSDSGYTDEVMSCIYESLWQVDPQTWQKAPGLSYNWTLEPTVAGGGLQAGYKYTFKLYANATWHDGTPLTSADVQYSFLNIWQQGPYDRQYVENIYRVDTPDAHTAVIYTNMSGYFEFSRASGLAILPKHVWKAYADAHSGNFTTFVPLTAAELTGSGPFKWVSQVPGEYIELARYADWYLGIEREVTTTTTTDGTLLLLAGVGIAVIVIVIIAGVYYFRIRK
jgi:ABC-type transport system substrate-binding protein